MRRQGRKRVSTDSVRRARIDDRLVECEPCLVYITGGNYMISPTGCRLVEQYLELIEKSLSTHRCRATHRCLSVSTDRRALTSRQALLTLISSVFTERREKRTGIDTARTYKGLHPNLLNSLSLSAIDRLCVRSA